MSDDGKLHNGPAAERFLPIVYDELRALAAVYLRREVAGHTLQPTALVHEAYLKLADTPDNPLRTREQFIGLAAHAIRQVLVDHARSRNAQKRGGDRQRVTLDEPLLVDDGHAVDVLDLDAALTRLASLSDRQTRVVELRFFGGLTERETADVLGVSERTVRADWQVARAWLWRELGAGP